LSFDIKEPWATHRSYQVLDPDEKAPDVFGRKEVTADRILLCYLISKSIRERLPQLTNHLLAKYGITEYVLVYVMRNILENDKLWTEITTNPGMFVRDKAKRDRFYSC